MSTVKKKKRVVKTAFKKGNKAGVGFGRPKLTEEEKKMTLLSRDQFKRILQKYMIQDLRDLRKLLKAANTPAMDKMIIKSIVNTVESGDQAGINWFLNHTCGKEKDEKVLHLKGELDSSIDTSKLSKEQLEHLLSIHESMEDKVEEK